MWHTRTSSPASSSMSTHNYPAFHNNERDIQTPSPPPVDDDHDDYDEDQGLSEDSSVEEIQDDEFPAYFTETNGRLYHSHPTSPYSLPVDTPEQERLTVNHNVLKRILGGNYHGPADAVLALTADHPRKALDMCTGNGRWVLDMAEEFPHVQFTGIDIVPIATRYPPPTVQFELCDINTRLRWDDSHFDLIHARDVILSTSDYEALLDEAGRLLRPGGLFLSVEWSNHISFHPTFDLTVDEHAPASVRFFDAVNHIMSELHGIWMDGADASAMISHSVHFNNVVSEQIYVPIGTWHQNEGMCRIGSSFRAGHKKLANAFRQMLIDSGISSEDVDTLVGEYVQELHAVGGLVSIAHVTHAERV